MNLSKKAVVVGALAAALILLVSVATSANTLSFRNSLGTREWHASWSEFGFGERTGRCSISMSGSLHSSSIAKVRSVLVGSVTSASTVSCGAFITATVLTANLPWHVRYQSFSGTLPSISAVNFQIIGFEYRIRETVSAITCLFRSTEEHPLNMEWNRVSEGSVTSARLTGLIPSECGLELNATSTPTSFTPSTTITLI